MKYIVFTVLRVLVDLSKPVATFFLHLELVKTIQQEVAIGYFVKTPYG